jgi:outer membrane protein OmpA-like peptidoglycan-associated protein
MLAQPGAAVDGLADGTWYFHVRAVDAQSSGPVSDYRFQIDATGPDVDMIGLTSGGTYLAEALPTPSIVASDPNMPDASGLGGVQWSCSNGESGSGDSSTTPITVPSAPGWYSYTVQATDLAGNKGPSRSFSLAIGLSSPKNVTFGPSSPTATTMRWAGCVGAEGYSVYVDGQLAGTTGADSSAFTFDGLLGPSHVVEVEAYIDEESVSARARGVYVLAKAVQIGVIRFAPNSNKLTPRSRRSLRAFAVLVKAQGFTTAYVDGYSAHADHGSRAYRARLSRARADAVKAYLIARFKAMKVRMRVVAIGRGAVPGSAQAHAPDRKAIISVK